MICTELSREMKWTMTTQSVFPFRLSANSNERRLDYSSFRVALILHKDLHQWSLRKADLSSLVLWNGLSLAIWAMSLRIRFLFRRSFLLRDLISISDDRLHVLQSRSLFEQTRSLFADSKISYASLTMTIIDYGISTNEIGRLRFMRKENLVNEFT